MCVSYKLGGYCYGPTKKTSQVKLQRPNTNEYRSVYEGVTGIIEVTDIWIGDNPSAGRVLAKYQQSGKPTGFWRMQYEDMYYPNKYVAHGGFYGDLVNL